MAPALVVLEATGGDEFEAACALQATGLAVALVNPRAARDFARAMGALAKTRALDARMSAAFARVPHQQPERERFVKPLADGELRRPKAPMLRRPQLVQMPSSEKQRTRIVHAAAHASFARHIELRTKELSGSDSDVAGQLQQQHAAQRAIWGGRHDERCTLYIASLVGVRHCNVFKAFQEHPGERSKCAEVALVAAMRKRLTVLNAIAKQGSRWNPMLHGA